MHIKSNSAVDFLYWWYMNSVRMKQESYTTYLVGLDVQLLLIDSCSKGDLRIADATLHNVRNCNVLKYSLLYRMCRKEVDNFTEVRNPL